MIRVLLALWLVALSGKAQAAPASPWAPHVAEASARFGIPPTWIWRVMQAESGGRTHWKGRPIRSRVGAMGLMQLMPGTWRAMRIAHGLGPDPDDPRSNILAGTAYLRGMYDRFGYPGLFAAYNAGPGRYGAYLGGGGQLPAETRRYVASILADMGGPVMQAGSRWQTSRQPRAAPTHLASEGASPGILATDTARARLFFKTGRGTLGEDF